MDVIGAMLGNLRAVPWFADTEPRAGESGRVVVEERGDIRTVPKGAKAEGVRGTASAVIIDEFAIVQELQKLDLSLSIPTVKVSASRWWKFQIE